MGDVVVRSLWLNGTVGTGKSTVGALVADRLEPAAFIATDALGSLAPPAEPFNTSLVAANLAAVTANFSAAGAHTLVVAGVVKSHAELELFEQAVGAPITLVRLVLPPTEVEARLRARHGDLDQEGLRWHLDRAPTLTAILDASGLSMIEVPNTGLPADTARAVIAAAGWA